MMALLTIYPVSLDMVDKRDIGLGIWKNSCPKGQLTPPSTLVAGHSGSREKRSSHKRGAVHLHRI